MNARKILIICFACALIGPQGLAAREYEVIKNPNIKITLPKTQAQPRPAPAKPPQSAQPAQPRQAKIPTFQKSGPVESGAQGEEAPPAPPPNPLSRNSGVKLFGTVEFRRPLDTLPGWLDVLDRNSRQPVFQPEKRLVKGEKWQALKGQAQGLPLLEKLRLVNRFWNQSPYREDMENWGKEDYWAIPEQFVRKSGDCEDYAIAKYFTLKELGVDPQSMRIVVLRDTIRNLAHAVLAVYVDGDAYILDNVTNIVLSHSRIRNYQPQFSVNESGRWSHIKGKAAR